MKESHFTKCQELIAKIKTGEIIATSTEPKTAAQVEEIVESEEAKRKNMRESRLQKFTDMADAEQKLQQKHLDCLTGVDTHLAESNAFKKDLLSVLDRMVTCMEKSNAYYVL